MISNAEINGKLVQAHDPELALYIRRELLGSPAILVGAHDTNRVRKRLRPPHGRAHRAGMWITHSLAVLTSMGGGRA
jgi:hypothetical protein